MLHQTKQNKKTCKYSNDSLDRSRHKKLQRLCVKNVSLYILYLKNCVGWCTRPLHLDCPLFSNHAADAIDCLSHLGYSCFDLLMAIELPSSGVSSVK